MIAMPRKSAKKLARQGNGGFKNLRPRRQMKARKAGPTNKGRVMGIGGGWV
jgi:hypothetical protein